MVLPLLRRCIPLAAVLTVWLVVLAGCGSSSSATPKPVNGNKAICGALLAWNKWSEGAHYPSPTADNHDVQVFEAAYNHENQLLMQRLDVDAPRAHSTALANAARGLATETAGRKGGRARNGWGDETALVCAHLGDWYSAAGTPTVPLPD